MTEYQVRHMTADDFHAITTNAESNLWALLNDDARAALLKTDAWAGVVDGRVVACGGVIRLWPGLADAWITVTPEAKRHASFVYRHVKAFLELVTETYHLRRIQATIRQDFITARQFAKRLGFVRDGILKKYGPNGETFVLVSKVM